MLMEVEETTETYRSIASTSSKLFFALKMFSQVNLFYQFSLKFYLFLIRKLLDENQNLSQISKDEYFSRIDCIETELFISIYLKTKFSVMGQHQLVMALRFAQIKLESNFSPAFCSVFKQVFLPSSVIESTLPENFLDGLIERNELLKLEHISKLPGFGGLIEEIERDKDNWIEKIKDVEADFVLEHIDWLDQGELGLTGKEMEDEKSQAIFKSLVELLLGSVMNPSESLTKQKNFVTQLLGARMTNEFIPDFGETLAHDADKNTPVLIATTGGYDVSNNIYETARKAGVKFEDCAIGSPEAFEIADRALEKASKRGGWVVLKNVHLAPSWLNEVEQNLHRMNPHQNFRLILLLEFTEKIPVTILSKSITFIIQPAEGIKISMNRGLLGTVAANRINREPLERARIHFLLLWIHCIIVERLRYTPTGWSKRYEFNESDLKCAMDVVDKLIDMKGARTNMPLEMMPWEAMQRIVTENVYGGKIDNEYDEKILRSIIEQHLTPGSYSPSNSMIDAPDPSLHIMYPDATKHEDFYLWVKALNKTENPYWSGLPASADEVLKIQELYKFQKVLNEVQDIAGQEIESLDAVNESEEIQVNWLIELAERVEMFLGMIPESLPEQVKEEDSMNNPLFRYLAKEISFGKTMLKKVLSNLKDVDDMAHGRIHPLQEIKNLGRNLHSNVVPKAWKKYIILRSIDAINWVTDFKVRLTQLIELSQIPNWQQCGISLGHFFFSEAFFTASRQLVSQNTETALDELELRVSFLTPEEQEDQMVDEDSFLVEKMYIEGVDWTPEGVSLSESMVNELHNIKFTWTKINPADALKVKENELFVPIYLNNNRSELLKSIKLDVGNCSFTKNQLYQRGIAFVLWRL